MIGLRSKHQHDILLYCLYFEDVAGYPRVIFVSVFACLILYNIDYHNFLVGGGNCQFIVLAFRLSYDFKVFVKRHGCPTLGYAMYCKQQKKVGFDTLILAHLF